MNLQTAHKISVIQTLFQDDEQLIEFLFSHKCPELRESPRKLLKESRSLSYKDQLLIQVAMDIWCEQGGAHLADLLSDWNHEIWINFLQAMAQLHEIAESE